MRRVWWTDQCIIEAVVPAFLERCVSAKKRVRLLDRPAFDAGLFDDIYRDWIFGKAWRCFLIIVKL